MIRNLSLFLFSAFIGFIGIPSGTAQTFQTQTFTENGYTYQTVDGDPTQTRIYTLSNGLKVYLSVYKDRPQIFTLIPVRAGSKNDPADNTGLAHYLEHMVFKGTSLLGAKQYAQEKILLDSLERMFNRYKKLKNPVERKAYYKKIDKVSHQASKLCYANEYDKIIAQIGGQGTNAFTSNEQTVYVNTIPSNQLEKWLVIEKERFSELVPRLFHTELEAVYEEKNISLDSDNDKVQETLYRHLYKVHPYGTQTTIGTIEHLKNPSISEIKKFFYTYYVPNNMAICLSGDLDPNRTIKLIDSTFGTLKAKPLPVWKAPVEAPLLKPVVKKVIGPSEEYVTLGFRLPGFGTRENIIAGLVDQMLQNSQAGLIDLNLNQKQKVLNAGCYLDNAKDYSTHQLFGSPRQGQSLAEVRRLLLNQLDSLRLGKFEDWLIPAIVNNMRITNLQAFDNNQGRVFTQMNAFIMDADWASIWKEIDVLKSVTKEEVMAFVKTHYSVYVAVDKVSGKDPVVLKIPKPQITPNAIVKDGSSDFFRKVTEQKSPPVEPQFLDFRKDLSVSKWRPEIDLLYKKNTSTPLFEISYLVKLGEFHDRKMELAGRLLELCGAGNLEGDAFKKELFKLGSEISVRVEENQSMITATGLNENFAATMALLEKLIQSPKATKEDLTTLVSGIKKERENLKINKNFLMRYGLVQYAKYGKQSPAHFVLSNEELNATSINDLLPLSGIFRNYPHSILYYGPMEETEVNSALSSVRMLPEKLSVLPTAKEFTAVETNKNQVYWYDYDMVQTELSFVSKSNLFDSTQTPAAQLYNEYMGGNMSSVVFQELRESKALAYSANAGYQLSREKGKPNYLSAYIGCQADKLPEAVQSMMEIVQNMPVKDDAFEQNKESLLTTLKSERITKSGILIAWINAEKMGVQSDIRKYIYENIRSMSKDELIRFHNQFIKGKNFTLVVLGKRDKINFEALKKFGPVQELKSKDLFGF